MAKHTMNEIPVVFKSNGNQLVGMLHKAGSDKIIIMCHGFKSNKLENKRLFVEAARMFCEQKFDVLRFDFYGSGDSEGEFEDTLISINIQNLKDAITFCLDCGYKEYAILGISMGAATSILTVNETAARVLVLWSSVPDMKSVFEDSMQGMGPVDTEKSVFEFEGWRIKKDFLMDALKYDIQQELKKVSIPKLIIQGTGDAPVFVKGFHDFREIVLPPADFMEIPQAGHTFQKPTHRKHVIRQTAIWLKRHF